MRLDRGAVNRRARWGGAHQAHGNRRLWQLGSAPSVQGALQARLINHQKKKLQKKKNVIYMCTLSNNGRMMIGNALIPWSKKKKGKKKE
jgi:hypothetical protein